MDSSKSELQKMSSFETFVFSISRVILLSLQYQSFSYFRVHIFNTLHQLVTVIYVGSPCLLTFAGTNLLKASQNDTMSTKDCSKCMCSTKVWVPNCSSGTHNVYNSNTPPPLCNLPQLSSYTASHIFSWKKKIFWFLSHKLWFFTFFFRTTAGNLGLTTPLILQSRHPDLQEVNVSAFSDLPYSTYCLAENLAFRSIKLFPLPATTIFLWWITRLDLLRS